MSNLKISDILGRYLSNVPMSEAKAIALVDELDTLMSDELSKYLSEYISITSSMMNAELDKFGIPSEGETIKIEDRTYTNRYTASGRITLALNELAAKNEAVEVAIHAMRAVIHDRPSAHTDEVWETVNAALAKLEALK